MKIKEILLALVYTKLKQNEISCCGVSGICMGYKRMKGVGKVEVVLLNDVSGSAVDEVV